jgi:hypothetical protein
METDLHPGRKGGTTAGVGIGIPHNHVVLPPLVPVCMTGACIPFGNIEIVGLHLSIYLRAVPGV